MHQQHLRPDSFEAHDAALPALAAIEADIVRPQAGREACRKQEVGVEPRNLDEQSAGALVPVDGEVAVEFLHAGGAFVDRLPAGGRLASARRSAATAAAARGRLLRLERDRREQANR